MSTSPAETAAAEARKGLLFAIGAFLIWGLLPLYLRPLHEVPALTIMSHRLVWCCLFVMIWLAARGELAGVKRALGTPSTLLRLCGSAVLISINWLVYVWSVGNGHVLDASLGYFINPLVNVLLGVVLLGERLNRVQWLSVATAASGVAWLTAQAGHVPWIALALAFSFSGYGLIRKLVAVDAITGLASETALIAPLGIGWLLWQQASGAGAFAGNGPFLSGWLIAGGLVTAVPLALFAAGARRIPYSTVGLIQYIGPTLQLLLGVFLFHEAFGAARAAGFVLIWTALALYAGDGLWRARRSAPPAAPVATAEECA